MTDVQMRQSGGRPGSAETLPSLIRIRLEAAYDIARLREDGRPYYVPFTVRQAIKVVSEALLIAGMALAVPWLIATQLGSASLWGSAAVCSFSLAAGVIVMCTAWRVSRDYRAWCTVAYYGTVTRLGPDSKLVQRHMRGDETDGVPEAVRMRDAHRWARTLTAATLIRYMGGAIAFWSVVVWLSWRFGFVHAVHPVSRLDAFVSAFKDISWNLADDVPILDAPRTLVWAQPSLFAGDRVAGLELLAAKVTVFLPLISTMVALFRRSEFSPKDHPATDPVARAVVESMIFRRERSRMALWGGILSAASSSLGEPWSPNKIREHLSLLPAKSIRGY